MYFQQSPSIKSCIKGNKNQANKTNKTSEALGLAQTWTTVPNIVNYDLTQLEGESSRYVGSKPNDKNKKQKQNPYASNKGPCWLSRIPNYKEAECWPSQSTLQGTLMEVQWGS